MNGILRIFKHLIATRWQVRRLFPTASVEAIEVAIAASETRHMGELRFVVEAALDPGQLYARMTARDRALEVFSDLRVWDTEENSGVLIYMLLADRRVEIVADRGINGKVEPAAWIAICQLMESEFRAGRFEQGVLTGIAEVTRLLEQHFPAQARNPDDLPNRPTFL